MNVDVGLEDTGVGHKSAGFADACITCALSLEVAQWSCREVPLLSWLKCVRSFKYGDGPALQHVTGGIYT